MANTPNIRFKGFADDWEQRKLGEVGTTYTGLLGKTKEDFGHGDGKFITYMNVFSNAISDLDMIESIEIDKKQNEVKVGDVFFTTSSETPEEVGMSCVLLEECENTYLNSFCFGYRPTEKFDNKYLAYMLRSSEVRKKITFLAQGISRYNISKNKVMEIEIPIPCLAEQEAIGIYFYNLDSLITFHQRKCDEVKQLKKYMLQKMFPKNGKLIPEIRFAGFTDDWEQHRLGEFSDIKTGPFGSTLHADDYINDGMPIITTEHFKSGQLPTVKDGIPQVSENDYCRLSSYILNTNDIVFSRVGSVDINALVTPFQDKWLFSGRVLRVRPYAEIDSTFLHTLLETDSVRNDIISRAVGQTMPSINTEILKITSLCLPQDIDEQREIGEYFCIFDRLINLHQHKCDQLKEVKRFMLQNMFPQKG